jgi:hypothetical protein
MEIGDDVADLIPDEPRPGPLRHVERECVLPAPHRTAPHRTEGG